MKVISNKQQRIFEQGMRELIELTQNTTANVECIIRENLNDRICGHWVNDIFSVSVNKMRIGYMISVFKDKDLIQQMTVISDEKELRINDYDVDAKRLVRYDKDTRQLSIDGCGDFTRDYEKKLAEKKKTDLYSIFNDGLMEAQERVNRVLDSYIPADNEPQADNFEILFEKNDESNEHSEMSKDEYADIFLKTTNANYDRKVLLDNSTYLKIQNTLYDLGVNICVSSFVENIVRQHFEIFGNCFKEWADELKVEN